MEAMRPGIKSSAPGKEGGGGTQMGTVHTESLDDGQCVRTKLQRTDNATGKDRDLARTRVGPALEVVGGAGFGEQGQVLRSISMLKSYTTS
jgi:hypothetical protein